MSDGQRIFTTVYAYISYWVFLGVFYLIFTGVMHIINVLFQFNQNSWLVGFIVLIILMNHNQARKASRQVTRQMEEEEK